MNGIPVNVVSVSSEESLVGGGITYKLGIQLPGGDVVYAPAPAETITKLQEAWAVSSVTEAQPPGPPRDPRANPNAADEAVAEQVREADELVAAARQQAADEHALEVEEARRARDREFSPELESAPPVEEYDGSNEEAVSTETVVWSALPEDLLPEHVKTAMTKIAEEGKPMPSSLTLQQVVQIRDAILDEYTADDWANLGYGASAPQEPQPVVNSVAWGEGSTQPPVQAYSRKVPSDSAGNPVVRNRAPDIDPGEVASVGDDDDDGTAQF